MRTAPFYACPAGTTLRGLEPQCANGDFTSSCEYGGVEGGAESGAMLDDLLIIPPDLARLVELWDTLSETLREDILALAETSTELPRHETT